MEADAAGRPVIANTGDGWNVEDMGWDLFEGRFLLYGSALLPNHSFGGSCSRSTLPLWTRWARHRGTGGDRATSVGDDQPQVGKSSNTRESMSGREARRRASGVDSEDEIGF